MPAGVKPNRASPQWVSPTEGQPKGVKVGGMIPAVKPKRVSPAPEWITAPGPDM